MPVFLIGPQLAFPPPQLSEPDGLLALGGDLSARRLLLAYRHGIFPWFSAGSPILWWSPDPRTVLFPRELHVSRRLQRQLRQERFEVKADSAFDQVISCCAANRRPGREDTWITPEMKKAYIRLHGMGYAHSIEAWRDGRLAGGLYGVSLGSLFFGESMFTLESNASKVALARLAEKAIEWGFRLIDCQMHTEHLSGLGARGIPRDEFLQHLKEGLLSPDRRGKWTQEFAAAPQ